MTRTVKVVLDIEEDPFVRGVKRSDDALDGLGRTMGKTDSTAKSTSSSLGRTSDSLGKVGSSAKVAGSGLDEMRRHASALDKQITDTERSITSLAKGFANTGDKNILSAISQQQSQLRNLKNVRGLLPDPDAFLPDPGKAEQSGRRTRSAFSKGFMSAGNFGADVAQDLGKLIPPELKIALLAGAVAAAPMVGAAVAGGIAGGAGGLGIAGGVALAMRDPKIGQAVSGFGKDVVDELTRSASAFGPEIQRSIGVARAEFAGLRDEFDRIFANSSKSLVPLVGSGANAFGSIIEGLDEVVAQAGPALDVIGQGLEGIGLEGKRFLEMIADNGETGADALNMLFGVIEYGIRQLTTAVDLVTDLYGLWGKIDPKGKALVEWMLGGSDASDRLAESTAKAAEGTGQLEGGLSQVSSAAVRSADDVKALTTAFDELFGMFMGVEQAQLRLAEVTSRATEELTHGARTLSIHTKEGQENRKVVLEQIEAAGRLRAANIKNGMAIEDADAAYIGQIGTLRATLLAAGYTATAIDGVTAAALAVPDDARVKVTAPGATTAEDQIARVRAIIARTPASKTVSIKAVTGDASSKIQTIKDSLARLNGKTITIKAVADIPAGMSIGQLMRARGGVTLHKAAEGLLQPTIAPPGTRYQWAEPETGGELFLPRKGINRKRGRELLAVAGEWYGMSMVPMARGGYTAAASGLVNVAPREVTAPRTRTGSRLETDAAYLSARDAVAALNRSLKENGKSWSVSTAKGRENRTALNSAIRAAQDMARAKFEETGSVQQANKAYDEHIRRLKATLRQQGVSAKAVNALVGRLAQRPTYDVQAPAAAPLRNSLTTVAFTRDAMAVEEALQNATNFFTWGKPTFTTKTAEGRDNLNQLFTFLSAANAAAQSRYEQTGNAKTATSLYNEYLAQIRRILTGQGMPGKDVDALLKTYGSITLTNRMGGVYEHAASGVLRDAHIASPVATARYAYAEQATGGELFAPKRGNLAKTRAEVGWAVNNWWGGDVSWSRGPGRSSSSSSGAGGAMTLRVVVQDGAVSGLVRVEVDEALGALADAHIYQTAG